MEREEVRNRYFKWLFNIVYRYDPCDDNDPFSFSKLAKALFSIPFQVEYPMDENRVSDGIQLRYGYGIEKDLDDRIVACCLDNKPCSVFEVMIALAQRCEDQIMSDHLYGNRTSQWYNEMVISLGLGNMTNANFDETTIRDAAERMMYHAFEPNGKGGLFTVRHPDRDIRALELWAQMCDHLNELLY